ncbi:MAG TPA: FHA domain-containing protein [Blastocatellia bacterium]|nr:FHA domain-containing protein [Blastocatellia bacterium]
MFIECPQCKSPIADSEQTVCDKCGALLSGRDVSKGADNPDVQGSTQVLDPASNPEPVPLQGPERRASVRIVLSSGDVFDRDISRPETTIGKGPRNDIVIADQAVSTHHAVISFDASDGHTISDVGSRNGTFVGGVRVAAKHKLRHGDVITVGRSRLTFRIAASNDTISINTADIGGALSRPSLPLTEESLASAIVSAGLAPKEEISRLTGKQQSLYQSIVENRLVDEGSLRDLMSRVFAIPTINLRASNIDEAVAGKFPARLAMSHRIFPVGEENGRFVIAVADPTDKSIVEDVSSETGASVELRLATATEISRQISLHYGARLVGVLPSGDKIEHVIDRAEVAIGKGLHNDVVLADPTVSNSHALVLTRDGCYNIVDLGSRNGTFVAGERLGDQARVLRHGDSIRVGQTVLSFRNPAETSENLTARLSNEFVEEVRRKAIAEDSAGGAEESSQPGSAADVATSSAGQPADPTLAISATQSGAALGSKPESGGDEVNPKKDKKEKKGDKKNKKSEKKAKEDERVKAAYVRAVGTIVASILGILLSVGIALYVNHAGAGAGKTGVETNKKGKAKVKIGTSSEAASFEGGTFQASGVVQAPGTNAVLFVDYDRLGEVFRMELNESGRQTGAIKSLPLGLNVKEPEGIAYGGSFFYVVGSLSDSSAGDQNTLARFTLDPSGQAMQGKAEGIGDLRAFLLANVPELKDAGGKKAKEGGLFVGGVAWDPDRERLLIGLQSPLSGGKALIAPIKLRDPRGAFSTDNLVLAGTETIKISLGGHGLRSIQYDSKLKSFVIISSDAEAGEKRVFKLWQWEAGSDSGPVEQSTLDSKIKPHAIARVKVGASDFMLVVGDGSSYMKVDYPEGE